MEILTEIHELIANKDFRRAEIVIKKALKRDLNIVDRTSLLIYFYKNRLQQIRYDDVISHINETYSDLNQLEHIPAKQQIVLKEALADAYLMRFENALVGFASKIDIESAKQLYEQIIHSETTYDNIGWIYYQYGRVLLALDDNTQAEKSFKFALFNRSPLVHLTALCYERLAFIAYYDQHQPEQAITFMQKAIQTYPLNDSSIWRIQAYITMANMLKNISTNKAIEVLDDAIHIARKDGIITTVDGASIMAEIHFAQVEINSHIENYQQVIEIAQVFFQMSKSPLGVDVTWARVYEMLGDAYMQQNAIEEAIVAYENTLQFNPYHPLHEAIKYRIAELLVHEHRYEETVSRLKQLIHDIESEGSVIDNPSIYLMLSLAYQQLGKQAESIKYKQMADKIPSVK